MTSSSNVSLSQSSEPPHVIACGAIARHIDEIAQRRGWTLVIHPLPPLLHNHPQDIAGAVSNAIADLHGVSKVAVAYADCGTYGALDAVLESQGIPRLKGEHCYDVFGGATRIADLLSEEAGTYFFTDYLVKSFHRSVIVELGLDRHPELRDDYFRHYKRVVWLAQSPTAELRVAAQAAAEVMGLACEEVVVGDLALEDQLEVLLFQN